MYMYFHNIENGGKTTKKRKVESVNRKPSKRRTEKKPAKKQRKVKVNINIMHVYNIQRGY